jgi:hypothetical protein
MRNITREKQLVAAVTQTGGVRIRPDEKQLGELELACRNFKVCNVGSLLVANLQEDFPFQKKVKTVITMQHLAKRIPLFQLFFRVHIETIRATPPPAENQANYRKLFEEMLEFVEHSTEAKKVAVLTGSAGF